MRLEELSKHKHVYRVYMAQTQPGYGEQIHVEKYPVIYANELITYVKDGRKQHRLSEVSTCRIGDHFGMAEAMRHVTNRTLDLYYWSAEDLSESVEALREFKMKEDAKQFQEAAERRLKKAEAELKKAQEAYDKLMKQ